MKVKDLHGNAKKVLNDNVHIKNWKKTSSRIMYQMKIFKQIGIL